MTAVHDKQALRARMLEVRRGITGDARARRSQALTDAVAATPEYAAARCVAAFVGVRDEPDTAPLRVRVLADRKRLALPRTTSDGLRFAAVDGATTLEPGPMRIPQPPATLPPLAPEEIDLVIVPGLAFDRAGFRVGYGGGYYDRFLAALPAGTPTIGIAYVEQVVEAVPRDAFDLPVALVVTA